MKRVIFLGILAIALQSCIDDEEQDRRNQYANFVYDFDESAEGWEGDFAEYPIGEAESYELEFEYDTLPEPLEDEGALRLSGTNMSDDLFMFAKRKIGGLIPLTTYYARFTVQFASNEPDSLMGIGGSPGESVWIKAGAVDEEPVPVEDDTDYYSMEIDKGGQSQGGTDMIVLGDFSNDTDEEVYTLKTVSNDEQFQVTTDENGELWLIVGTDSGFEGNTRIYYNVVQAEFYMEEIR